MSGYNSPVDEPPGEQGHQGVTNPDAVPDVPVWEPGTNPPGTNPPVDPPVDPATVPVPGSIPTHDQGGAGTAPVAGPPVNVDVPHVSQAGDTLTCTMGNWENTPTTYSYVWALNGTTVGTDADTYTIVAPDDVGQTAICTVTASNASGATTAPASNEVIVADPTSEDEAGARRRHRRHE